MSKLITVHYDNKQIYDIVIEQGFSSLAESFNKQSLPVHKGG